MPIYEFLCTDCQDSFERLLSYSAVQEPVCPFCGSAQTRRKLSAPAIHFKGGGFYLTESRKEAESKSETETADKGDSKSDADSKSDTDTTAESRKESPNGSRDRKDGTRSTDSGSDPKAVKSESASSKVATDNA